MPELPVEPIVRPSCLNGQTNGHLPDSLLWPTPGQAGGPVVRLVEPAARAWRAMCAAALKAGHTLKATSYGDSYRWYELQYTTFVARYLPDKQPDSIGSRYWPKHYDLQDRVVLGRLWWQKPDTAVAAVPGTSNHGWGLAVDTGEEIDGDAGTESLDDATLAWLIANEKTFGFSHEVQSEKWHIRYWAGDAIPAAVLAYEQSLQQGQESDMRVYSFSELADCPPTLEENRVVITDSVGAYWVRPNSWQYGSAALNGISALVVKLGKDVAGALPLGTTFAKAFSELTGGCVYDPATTYGLADWRKSAGGGTAPGGPVNLSDEALDEVRAVVDEELDEQSRGGADAGV